MIFAVIPGALLIAIVLWDVFEAIVLPRRVSRTWRPTRYFYRISWRVWSRAAGRISASGAQETVLSFYGPMSIILLLATWGVVLIVAFALIQWALGSHLIVPGGHPRFRTDLYLSGTTFFTLGLGDVSPGTAGARAVTVIEAGTGFGFLALVIGYLPVFYQAFSRREVNISLLDARAGSPPTAGELLRRFHDDARELPRFLLDSERWAADLLESHLSYPLVAFFRSQHERQSWVAALTAILDVSAILIVCGEGDIARAAQLTFAMARHAAVDLSQIFVRQPRAPQVDRLWPEDFAALRALAGEHPALSGRDADGRELAALRATYEPYVNGLAQYLLMPLPPWMPAPNAVDAWQTSPEEMTAPGVASPASRR